MMTSKIIEINPKKNEIRGLLEIVLLNGKKYDTLGLFDFSNTEEVADFKHHFNEIMKMMIEMTIDLCDETISFKTSLHFILHEFHQIWNYEDFIQINDLKDEILEVPLTYKKTEM